MTSRYKALVYPKGKRYVIAVQGVGTTQAGDVADIDRTARDLILAMTGTPPDDVDLTVAVPKRWWPRQ